MTNKILIDEALRLADALTTAVKQIDEDDQVVHVARWFVEDSAAELRRLHAENQALRQALANEALDKMAENARRIEIKKYTQEEGSAEYWASKYPVPLGYELVKKNPQPAPRVVDCYANGVCVQSGLRAEQPAQEPHTYASTQATNCAACGKHKHTPLRIDAMGGYVCLTCIDVKLGSMLGEFGYPEPAPCTSSPMDCQCAIDAAHGITKGGA